MITFPCKCGQVFNLTEDMAGGLVQCRRCGLLADVPSLSDLPYLADDGTIKIGDAAPITDGIGLGDLQEAFSTKTVDSRGHEKDLRPGPEHFRAIGTTTTDEPPRVAPRYDPGTGELIRPMELVDEVPRPVLPVDATVDDVPFAKTVQTIPAIPATPAGPLRRPKSIGYAVGESRKQITPATLAIELLMPQNAIVLFFVFVFYVFSGAIGSFLAIGGLFFQVWLQVLNIPLWLILAHYGCVIEDTGPDSRDELPRPLRHFALGEDIIGPFFRVATAGVICFFPVFIASMPKVPLGNLRLPVMLLMELIGSFFLPAVLLTSVTGTTLLNLRPDRVLSVIRHCGPDYILSFGVFLLTLIPSTFYLVGPSLFFSNASNKVIQHMSREYVSLPLLALCVYLTHLFCWHLGLMYRAHHDEFPWLMQRHIRRNRATFEVLRAQAQNGQARNAPARTARRG